MYLKKTNACFVHTFTLWQLDLANLVLFVHENRFLLSFILICLHTMFATWLKRVTLWKQSNMCVVCQLEETTSILLSSAGRGAKSIRLVCHTQFAFCKLYAKCPIRHAWCQRYAYTLAWCRYFYVYQWWQILRWITLYVCTVYIRGKRSCQLQYLVVHANGKNPCCCMYIAAQVIVMEKTAITHSCMPPKLTPIHSPSSKCEHRMNRTTPRSLPPPPMLTVLMNLSLPVLSFLFTLKLPMLHTCTMKSHMRQTLKDEVLPMNDKVMSLQVTRLLKWLIDKWFSTPSQPWWLYQGRL